MCNLSYRLFNHWVWFVNWANEVKVVECAYKNMHIMQVILFVSKNSNNYPCV